MGLLNKVCYLGGGATIAVGLMGGIEIGSNSRLPPSDDDTYADSGGASSQSAQPPNPYGSGSASSGAGWDPNNLPPGTGESPWMDSASQYLGLKESGTNRGDMIDQWNTQNGGSLGDPWCATFVNHTLGQSGLQGTGSASSQSFRNWGVDAGGPVTGSIVVFKWSNSPGGHVGYVQSVNSNGTINVLGGNQSNGVSVSTFSTSQVVGYRLPPGYSGGGINTGSGGGTPGGGYEDTR